METPRQRPSASGEVSAPAENVTGFPFPRHNERGSATVAYRFHIANVNKSVHLDDDESYEFDFDEIGDDETEDLGNRVFFNDNTRQVDFVLVAYTQKTMRNDKNYNALSKYMQSLAQKGLQFEYEKGKALTELKFIKIYCPSDILLLYAQAFRMRLSCKSFFRPEQPTSPLSCMDTLLTSPNINSNFFQRAKNALSGERPQRMTPTERIMVTYKILCNVRFTIDKTEYSLERLMAKKIIVAAYPLHPGPWEWSENGPLSDRQLLAAFWARLTCFYKLQPLNVVERYFGGEMALYFAFVGFYNSMLIWASLVGVAVYVVSIVTHGVIYRHPLDEICNSKETVCPAIYWEGASEKPLSSYCFYAKFTYIADSPFTVFYAIFIAFWATVFMEMWKRKLNTLFLRWSIREKKTTRGWRHQFELRTKKRRLDHLTGNIEPYVPLWRNVLGYLITIIITLILILIILLAIMSTVAIRLIVLEKQKLEATVILVITSCINVIFIKLFGIFYNKVAVCLTDNENHKSQWSYDASYIYKRFILAFVNNYSIVFYLAFFRGYLYTYPGDHDKKSVVSFLRGDACHPTGCLTGLFIQMLFIMVFKSLLGNLLAICWRTHHTWYRQEVKKKGHNIRSLGQWEQDFLLQEANQYYLVNEYIEMVIQYGFIVFFVAAFPLAPLCALISNLIEVRTDAVKLVRYCRRPIPVRKVKTSTWFGILQAITYLGTVVNAFVLTFTSDIVKTSLYRSHQHLYLKGYVNSSLSRYQSSNSTCLYRGMRYGPEAENKYKLVPQYWYYLTVQFVAALIIEHILLALLAIMAYAIPDVPHDLRKLIQHHRLERRKTRMREAEGKITVVRVGKTNVVSKND